MQKYSEDFWKDMLAKVYVIRKARLLIPSEMKFNMEFSRGLNMASFGTYPHIQRRVQVPYFVLKKDRKTRMPDCSCHLVGAIPKYPNTSKALEDWYWYWSETWQATEVGIPTSVMPTLKYVDAIWLAVHGSIETIAPLITVAVG